LQNLKQLLYKLFYLNIESNFCHFVIILTINIKEKISVKLLSSALTNEPTEQSIPLMM